MRTRILKRATDKKPRLSDTRVHSDSICRAALVRRLGAPSWWCAALVCCFGGRFLVCRFGMPPWSWYAVLMCRLGGAWQRFMVCRPGVPLWCAALVWLGKDFGVPSWCAVLVRRRLDSWCAALVCRHGERILVCRLGVPSWCAALVHRFGTPLWCAALVTDLRPSTC